MGSAKRIAKLSKKQSFVIYQLTFLLLLLFPYQSFPSIVNSKDSCCTKSYDVVYYNLDLSLPRQGYINGKNTINFKFIDSHKPLTFDLSDKLKVDSILYLNRQLSFKRDSNKIIIDPNLLHKSEIESLTIYYSGQPIVATNPPWEGGIVWSKDSLSRPFWAVTCEDVGAGTWWPSNNFWNDEPDSMNLSFTVPDSLYCVSNGRLKSIQILSEKFTKYTWTVLNQINTYNPTFYIGKYKHFSDTLNTNGSTLSLDFYPLDYHYQSAKKHFNQTKKILRTFQELFGPFPFPEDGYKLVEAPYWGMEHQSAVAYGNKYQNDMPGFDFIIVHETAHEWWGNSITSSDPANMWIHEAFATYSEALLLEKTFGRHLATKYLLKQKQLIKNEIPVAGPLNVNYHNFQDTDMYYKGAWMLHTLRNILNNDEKWFKTLKDINLNFKHSIVSREEITNFFNKSFDLSLHSFFSQYLDYTELPTLVLKKHTKQHKTMLEYQLQSKTLMKIPIEIKLGDTETIILDATSEKKIAHLDRKIKKISAHTEKYLINYKITN